MSNKVTVNIFGQSFTIAGNESNDRIIQVASWVDNKMREIEEATGNKLPTSSMAILSAVNIANEYFQNKDNAEEAVKLSQQLETDNQHYIQLWEEAKKNLLEVKDENIILQRDKEQLMLKVQAKEREIEKILQGQGSIEEEAKKRNELQLKSAEAKYKDLENNFFDLQMENIRIKSELEKLRGKMK